MFIIRIIITFILNKIWNKIRGALWRRVKTKYLNPVKSEEQDSSEKIVEKPEEK